MFKPELASLFNHLFRKSDWKRRVVFGVNEQGLFSELGIPLNVMRRADSHPGVAQLLDGHGGFQALPDVLRRKSFPNHIGEISGAMIKDVDLQTRIVRAG